MTEPVRYKSFIFDSDRWQGFAFRPDDIVISTPPKCGTTWTQMICALLIFQTPELPRKLDHLSPWVDMQTRPLDEIVGELEAQTHRRFIKTHTPLDGFEFRPDVTYIGVGRDPRDVAISWDNHVANVDMVKLVTARAQAVGLDDVMEQLTQGPPERPEREIDRFWQWVDDDTAVTEAVSLHTTFHHLRTFWDVRDAANIVLLHYDELLDDLAGQMRTLARRLQIDVPAATWPELVEAARFANMRERSTVLTPEDIWQNKQEFFKQGASGQWKRLLDDDDVKRYAARARELAPHDLLQWAHHGAFPTD